jgi:putative oxidoreductase
MDILAYVLQGLLALMFLMAGFGKVTGSKMHVEGFEHWKLPQWFRVVTGIVELVGAAALIIGYWEPSWAAAGALLLGITAIGGILTHLRVKDSFKQTSTILVLGILAFILFFIRLSDLASFPGFN